MEAPKLPSFIRQNKHKSFEFKPRYYDERKERIEELRRKYGKKDATNAKADRERLREDLSGKWHGSRQTKVNSSNRTLLLIIVALLALTYYLIK